MNGNLAAKNSNICIAYMGKGCSLHPYCISTIHVGEGGHDYMEVVGTLPWMGVVEPSLEQRPRATQEAKADDYMKVGGRMKWEPESRSGSFEILRKSSLFRADFA